MSSFLKQNGMTPLDRDMGCPHELFQDFVAHLTAAKSERINTERKAVAVMDVILEE